MEWFNSLADSQLARSNTGQISSQSLEGHSMNVSTHFISQIMYNYFYFMRFLNPTFHGLLDSVDWTGGGGIRPPSIIGQ